jgi:hypothetical protein
MFLNHPALQSSLAPTKVGLRAVAIAQQDRQIRRGLTSALHGDCALDRQPLRQALALVALKLSLAPTTPRAYPIQKLIVEGSVPG